MEKLMPLSDWDSTLLLTLLVWQPSVILFLWDVISGVDLVAEPGTPRGFWKLQTLSYMFSVQCKSALPSVLLLLLDMRSDLESFKPGFVCTETTFLQGLSVWQLFLPFKCLESFNLPLLAMLLPLLVTTLQLLAVLLLTKLLQLLATLLQLLSILLLVMLLPLLAMMLLLLAMMLPLLAMLLLPLLAMLLPLLAMLLAMLLLKVLSFAIAAMLVPHAGVELNCNRLESVEDSTLPYDWTIELFRASRSTEAEKKFI